MEFGMDKFGVYIFGEEVWSREVVLIFVKVDCVVLFVDFKEWIVEG